MHANPGSYEEYQEDVRKTKAARLSHGEAARSRTATKSPRDKGAAKSRSPVSSAKKIRSSKKTLKRIAATAVTLQLTRQRAR